MTTFAKSLFLAAGFCLLTSSLASAQTLAGTVRDTSGAVLPGVTVEASSPALIEKTRTAVADGSGQYQITNLPPGTYTITFSLQGFATVVREGVELTGGGVTTHQRRAARGRRGREHHGHGRNASRRRAVGPAADRAQRRGRAGAAGIARLRQLPGRPAGHPGHGLQQRRRDEHQLLHGPWRPRQRGRRPDRRPERRVAVQRRRRVQLRVRHEQLDRSPGVDLRRPGRGRPRCAHVQHHPQDGRQQFQRERLRRAGPASGARPPTSTTSCARWASPKRRLC